MPANRNTVAEIVKAYASAIKEASGTERDDVVSCYVQLEELVTACYLNSGLADAFSNNETDEDSRRRMALETFSDFDEALREILATMAVRGDLVLIRRIVDEYVDMVEKELGAVIVRVTTAIELDDHLRDVIRAKLSRDFDGRDILLDEEVDPKIIGGIIMSAHGRRIDASISTMLEESRVALSKSTTGGER